MKNHKNRAGSSTLVFKVAQRPVIILIFFFFHYEADFRLPQYLSHLVSRVKKLYGPFDGFVSTEVTNQWESRGRSQQEDCQNLPKGINHAVSGFLP